MLYFLHAIVKMSKVAVENRKRRTIGTKIYIELRQARFRPGLKSSTLLTASFLLEEYYQQLSVNFLYILIHL